MRRATIALIASVAAYPALGQTAGFLQSFQGEWHGTGQSRTDINSPYVPAECEITMEWTNRGLRSDGFCSGASQRFHAGGVISTDLTGTFMTPYLSGAVNQYVAIEQSKLVAYFTYNIDETKLQFRVAITQPRTEGSRVIIEMRSYVSVNDGPFTDAAQLTLVAQ